MNKIHTNLTSALSHFVIVPQHDATTRKLRVHWLNKTKKNKKKNQNQNTQKCCDMKALWHYEKRIPLNLPWMAKCWTNRKRNVFEVTNKKRCISQVANNNCTFTIHSCSHEVKTATHSFVRKRQDTYWSRGIICEKEADQAIKNAWDCE